MTPSAASWPCPVCVEIVPVGHHDCPQCGTPAAWIDQLNALDFAIRRFHWWNLSGTIDKAQYRQLVDYCRTRRDEMTTAAQTGQSPSAETGLPPRSQCWNCRHPCAPVARRCAGCGVALDTPEVRLARYQTFLGQEIRNHLAAARLTPDQAQQMLAETTQSLNDLRARLAAS